MSHTVAPRRPRLVLLALPLLTLAACSGGAGEDGERSTDTLTRRQKDSIVSTLPVPGAGAVGKALRATDSLRSRAVAHDTIR